MNYPAWLKKRLSQICKRLARRLDGTDESPSARSTIATSLLEANESLAAKYDALKLKFREKDKKVFAFRTLYNSSKPYFPLYYQGFLAEAVAKSSHELAADCYVALLPSSLPAALELKRLHGGRVFCDNVENVEAHKHSAAPRWSPTALSMVNYSAYGAMLEADGLITVGNALAKTLARFHKPVHVLKNFREFHEPEPNDELRKMCHLTDGDVLLFASGNVVIGLEAVLEALATLPENFHLAGFLRIVPVDYRTAIEQKIAALNLGERVHLFPFVEYERLAHIAAGADIGLITSDVANPNGAVGLPNRCFDYITAGLPVVAPPMPDVQELTSHHGFGLIVDPTTPSEWRRNIIEIYENLNEYRAKAIDARRTLTWESQDPSLYQFLGEPRSVTLIGFRDLTRYQRYKRLSRTLLKYGCTVKAAFVSVDPDLRNLVPGINYYATNEKHGVTNGLIKLNDGNLNVS